jgi:hypothetical protein
MSFRPEGAPQIPQGDSEGKESREQKPAEVYVYARDLDLREESGKTEKNTSYAWEGRMWMEGKSPRLARAQAPGLEDLAQHLAANVDASITEAERANVVPSYQVTLAPSELLKKREEERLAEAENVRSAIVRALTEEEANTFMEEYKKSRKIIPHQ